MIPNVANRKLRLLICALIRAQWTSNKICVRNLVQGNELWLDGEMDTDTFQAWINGFYRSFDSTLSWQMSGLIYPLTGLDLGYPIDVGLSIECINEYALKNSIKNELINCVLPIHTLIIYDPVVRECAKEIYEYGRWDWVGILGDMIEEYYPEWIEIISHCRKRHHAKGCWVIDLALGKG